MQRGRVSRGGAPSVSAAGRAPLEILGHDLDRLGTSQVLGEVGQSGGRSLRVPLDGVAGQLRRYVLDGAVVVLDRTPYPAARAVQEDPLVAGSGISTPRRPPPSSIHRCRAARSRSRCANGSPAIAAAITARLAGQQPVLGRRPAHRHDRPVAEETARGRRAGSAPGRPTARRCPPPRRAPRTARFAARAHGAHRHVGQDAEDPS